VNSDLTRDGLHVAVEIVETQFLSRKLLIHPALKGTYVRDNHLVLVYRIPGWWKPDVQKFMKGQFSQMTENAKNMILRYSRLPYRERDANGKIVTDGRLLSLERHKALKEMWEETLEPREEIQGELLSIPGAGSYIDLEHLTPIQKAQP
jgi:hypothetical protein